MRERPAYGLHAPVVVDAVEVLLLGTLEDVLQDGWLGDEVVPQLLLICQSTLNAIEPVVILLRELRVEKRLVLVP